jgi:iron complex outermembrane receptor protein
MFSGFIEAQQVNDNMRLPGALSPQLIDENRRQTTTDSDFTNIDTDRYRVGGEAAINQQWKFAAEYSYRSSDSTGVFFSTQFADATTVKSFTPRAIGNVELPYGVLVATVGYDYQSAEYKSNLTFNHVEQDTDDVYGQLVIPIYRDITATTGLRHSRIEQKNITASATKDDSETLRTLGLAWQADSALRIFARYDRNFRWANADENGYTLPGVTFLKPQTSDSYEAGINWKQGSLEVDVVLFRLNTDNELLFDPAAGFFGANINLEHSRRDGLSTELRWAVLDNVVLRASAAHVDAEVRAGNFKGKQVPFVAEQNASVGIDWKIGALFTVYADAQYTGRRFRSGDDPNIVGELGGHTIYNTGVRAQLDQWYVTLRVNNVTQKEYEGFSGVFISGFGNFEYAYPAAERQTWLSAGYKF